MKLAVANMNCVSCVPIVRGALSAVPGVTKVARLGSKTDSATVTFDDQKTTCRSPDRGGTNAGYPTKLAAAATTATAMNDATLIKTGAIGAVVAAICCATPVLVHCTRRRRALGADRLSRLVLLPILALCIGAAELRSLQTAAERGSLLRATFGNPTITQELK